MKKILYLLTVLILVFSVCLLSGCADAGAESVSLSDGKDKYMADSVTDGKPESAEPQDVQTGTAKGTVTISISCATILNNLDKLDPDKKEIIPEDGWILKPVKTEFTEGESVFDLLLRVCRENNIHMEYSNTPIYNSVYIEGIYNLYESDCGELSGWMYKVDEWFPDYGCSLYQLKDGNIICWEYTCDMGNDVGGGAASESTEN